jgi:tRNA(Ile)-lysidine synthetase-like protein
VSTTEKTPPEDLCGFFDSHGIDIAGGIIAAFSGGADSLGMLVLLKRTVPAERLLAVYVNHRIRDRKELQAEEELNVANCEKLGVRLRLVDLGPDTVAETARQRKHGVEESARYLRYTVLEEIRREFGFTYIATAHTRDDQMETRIMRIFQGSGTGGLKGISPVALPLIRPVLQYDKEDLVRILQEERLTWSQDSTNGSDVYLRNAIRHKLLPVVKEIFPGYRSALETLGEKNASLDAFIEEQVAALPRDIMENANGCVRINGNMFNGLARPLRERLFFKAWSFIAGKEGDILSYHSLRYALGVMESSPSNGMYVTLQGCRLTFRDGTFFLRPNNPVLAGGYVSLVYSYWTPLCGRWGLVRKPFSADKESDEKTLCIDEDTLFSPFVARSAGEGDIIMLKEGTKSITKLFGEWGIDPAERWFVPVLEDRVGVFAVLGRAFGGNDRLARRCLLTTLARKRGTLYSVMEYKD